MSDEHESKEEMVERLTRQFRELLERKLPDESGTLEEIERVTEEIGTEIKREIEGECLGWHGSGYVGCEIACSCGGVSKFKNYYPKQIVSLCGETSVTRAYYHCSSCGQGYVPLDATLGLDDGRTSVCVRTKVGRLAAMMPFGDVSFELGELCGIHISRNTAWRIAESMGSRVKEERSERERMILSGMIEVPDVAVKRLYIGAENANDLACLGDGAIWIWNDFSKHYPDAVHILDYYHATEHLDNVSKAWYGEGSEKAKCWLEARESDLLSDCVEDVIKSIRAWHPVDDKAKEIRRVELGYIERNRDRMLYASVRENGYHIGSGLVESACKTIVTQRFKQSGMRWSEPGAESMMHLRSYILSDRSADISHFARAA